MKVLVASPDNAVFRIINELLLKQGHTTERIGSVNIDEIVTSSEEYDYLVLNQKTSMNRRITERVDSDGKIVDLSLSKTQMKRYSGKIVSLAIVIVYPGTGNEMDTRFILAEDVSVHNSDEILANLLGVLNLESMISDEIDKLLSEVLMKPYLLALLSRKVSDLDLEKPTAEYRMIQDLARIIDNYNIDQIRDFLRNNPNTGKMIANFEENVKRVWNELSNY